MLKVGITGGMGTGKSTVCKIFNVLGIPTFDADREAKELYSTDEILKQKVLSRFGADIYLGGVFQKHVLANYVFNDEKALADLNALVHPLVIAQGEEWFGKQTAPYAIKEAALLIESGGYNNLDKLILVKTSMEERLERLEKRDGVGRDELKKRIEKQMPEDEKEAYADYIIDNDSNDKIIDQVLHIHSQIKDA